MTFRFVSVAHLEAPAAITATTLESLRQGIASAPERSIFQHVTRLPVRHPHARDLPGNDFSRWAGNALQAPETAERLAFAGAPCAQPIEAIRAALLAVLDSVPARERKRESSEEAPFHFLTSRTVEVPLPFEANDPAEAVEVWPRLDSGAIFFHLIEAPVFGREECSFPAWLRARGAGALAEHAEQAVAAGRPIARLKKDLAGKWRRSQIGRRVAERAGTSEEERRNEAREIMARLAGRIRGARDAGDGPERSP